MRIRDAEIKDAAAIAALLGELGYPARRIFAPTRSRASSRRTHACWSRKPGRRGVLGFIGLHFIVQLALAGRLLPHHVFLRGRGGARGLGVGRELEETPRGWRERGCDRIEVHCHERRVDAHRLTARYEESPKYLMKRA